MTNRMLLVVLFSALWVAPNAGAQVATDGSVGARGPVGSGTLPDGSTTTYLIADSLGKQAGGNLFHSFSTFTVNDGESATFTGPAGIENIVGRVTGGIPSSIDGLIRSTMDGANLYLLNPSGVMFGPHAALDVSGSFHVSTADFLRFSDGATFHANLEANRVLSVASPAAFGFLGGNPAPISVNQAALAVAEGKTLSLVGGGLDVRGNPEAPFYVLAAPGGQINVVSVASAGEVDFSAGDLVLSSFSRLGGIRFDDWALINVVPGDFMFQPGGTVVIRGGQMLFKDGGIDAYGDPGGRIDLKGDSLCLDNYYLLPANAGVNDHPGRSVRIDLTGELSMIDAASIDSGNFGTGRAGDIDIRAGTILLGDEAPGVGPGAETGFYGAVNAWAYGSGRGGDISLSADGALVVRNAFYINTTAADAGDAGNISIRADSLSCLDQGNVGSVGQGLGNAGTLDIVARNVFISAANSTSIPGVSAVTGLGSQAYGESNAGDIRLTADSLQLLDGGKLTSALFGSGRGANVEINVRSLRIAGYYTEGDVYRLSAIDGRVFGADASGTGGDITVNADDIQLVNTGVIRTGLYADAPDHAQAGNITVNADTLEIASRGQIYADSFRGTGNSGDVAITANSLHISGAKGTPRPDLIDFDFTGLSTTTNAGKGGAITVTLTGDLTMSAEGGIKADTQGIGTGGSIAVSARNLLFADGASINAASTGTGDAGDIRLTAADSLWMRDSSVTTDAVGDVNGGNIFVQVPNKLVLFDSRITSSVGSGSGGGGNIAIDPEFVVLGDSRIVANAWGGPGGNIQIVSNVFLADPGSVVDASSALGVDGTVDIRAPISNVSGLVGPLSADFTSASALLRERCIARIREGKYSSFVVGGRDGLPLEPGNLLPGLSF